MGWVLWQALPRRLFHPLTTITNCYGGWWGGGGGSRRGWNGVRWSGMGMSEVGCVVVVVGGGGQHLMSRSCSGGGKCRFISLKSRVDARRLAIRDLKLIRRRSKLRKSLMTEEEALTWRLQKGKRKAALLEQRLRKFVLPDDPEPVHDPELITPEQHQALKKIGYKNRNYVPVGRRGVYGGVVQNMHMHWKKHETVQVDCQYYKQSVVREMAAELVRLSGGIVIDIHQQRLVIMYRGRNYRQPKEEMIPRNTLTKRKALFKSKYDQALEMVQMNMINLENKLKIIMKRKAAGASSVLLEDSSSVSNDAMSGQLVPGRYGMLPMVGEHFENSSRVDGDNDSDWKVNLGSDSDDFNDVCRMLDHKKLRDDGSLMEGGGDKDVSINNKTREEGIKCYAKVHDENKSSLELKSARNQRQRFKSEKLAERVKSKMGDKRRNAGMTSKEKRRHVHGVSVEDELSYFSDLDELDDWEKSEEGSSNLATIGREVRLKEGSSKASNREEQRQKVKAQALSSTFDVSEDEVEPELEKHDGFERKNPNKLKKVDSGTKKQQRIDATKKLINPVDKFIHDSNDGDESWEGFISDEEALQSMPASTQKDKKKVIDSWFGDTESDIDSESEEVELYSRNDNRHEKYESNSKRKGTSNKASEGNNRGK